MTTRIFRLRATRKPDFCTEEMLTLSLRELLPDAGGEVVIHNRADTEITVLTDDPVIERGIARDHITSAGCDVAGFAFCRFAGGTTVFYPRSLSLCVADAEAETV